ncbi:MAG: hypothetical protein Q4E65_07395 [Clostridia bacterium]|nr:hypothetical protein [Clostridia bacterium]
MSDLICNEPIIITYLRMPSGYEKGRSCFVSFIGGNQASFHATPAGALIFETQNYYVEVTSAEVSVMDRTKPIASQFGSQFITRKTHDEIITLFSGERIHSTVQYGDHYEIILDDFRLRVEWDDDDCSPMYEPQYGNEATPVHGYERHLTERCECGGQGKIWLDQVDDFFIRCDRCHRSTCSHMAIMEAVKAWNMRDTPCNIDFARERLDEFLHAAIDRFAVSVEHASQVSNQSCNCEGVIMVTDIGMLGLELCPVRKGCCTFAFNEISSYDPEAYAWLVTATPDAPITFLDKIYDDDGELQGLKFKYGNRFLFLYALEYSLLLTKSIIDLEAELCMDDLPAIDDSILFNKVYHGKND